MSQSASAADLSLARESILTLLRRRGPHKSICPSEAAKALSGGNWRSYMSLVRRAAAQLEEERLIDVRQGCRKVPLATARGPIRLCLVADRG